MNRSAPPIALLALCLLPLGVARAAPFGLRLSYVDDEPSSLGVTWNTTADAPGQVRYGLAPGVYTWTESAASNLGPSELGTVHEAILSGLEPGTTYYYVAGSSADGFSAERSFTTRPLPHPTCGNARFVFLADNRPDRTFGGGQNWAQILEQAAVHRPAFVLNGGDLVTDGDNYSGWVDFLNWTAPVSASIPFMPCLGNHDDGPGEGDGANYNRLFSLPRSTGENASGTEDYYYFTYAHAIVAVLSTETYKGGAIPFAEQAAWLDRVLTENPRKWKFVMLHKPIYTKEVFFSISHEPNEAGQNAALVPVFDAHHVDVVFTSHNHWYERFQPSACAAQGRPGSSEPCPVGAENYAAGTVYYVSGGAGAFTIPGLLCGWQTGRVFCSGDHHYLLASIEHDTLTLETWGAYPQNNRIIDGITIVKPGEDCGDQCPDDPLKTEPGQCGCGVPDADRDGDGAADCLDQCPDDPLKIAPGACGCGTLETDGDGDGTPDCLDSCPDDPLKTAPGLCGCGVPEADPCQDLCPEDPLKTAPGLCGCGVPDTDRDADGTPDCLDPCPEDPLKTEPGQCGCGVPDADRDADGTPDCLDSCPDDPDRILPGPDGCGPAEDSAGCGCAASTGDASAGLLLLLLGLLWRRGLT
jgi:hypothetical protein